MASGPKHDDLALSNQQNEDAVNGKAPEVESGDEEEQETDQPSTTAGAAGAKKKKKSKRKRVKEALTGGSSIEDPQAEMSRAMQSLSQDQIQDFLAMNPALAKDLGLDDNDISSAKTMESFRKLNLHDVMTGLAANGKNVKDMASYKFWQTQPVPKFDDKKGEIEEGPFKIIDVDKVPEQASPLPEGYEWVTMDLTRDGELKEVFELLYGHYVEDDDATFRFNYSISFLKWALLAPGWTKEWHVGVRTSASQRLVAFISGVPVTLRVRTNVIKRASEINFLCIHKKLRSKRLAPVLIKEVTRRCYRLGTFQAIYTAGVVLPTPVSTCRYFHRALDWQKLYEVGFSPLPKASKPAYQVRKYALPDVTSVKGLRPMESKDVDAVLSLLTRYLATFDMAPVFTGEEIDHWMLHKEEAEREQVIYSYVVEDPSTKKVTDFFSFYTLESSVLGNDKHKNIRAAYLFYYASELALQKPRHASAIKERFNSLIQDALILAKRYKFDVFNALTLMENSLFLEEQKFGGGDGQLHYYLYNYKANPIAGGVDRKNQVDESCSGIGVVML